MKKNLLFTSILLLGALVSQAQWQPDVRLTNNPAVSYTTPNSAKCIASNGDTIHVVWRDLRDGNPEIYYKRSINRGINWENDQRLTNSVLDAIDPSIYVNGSKIHVAYNDNSSGSHKIFYLGSADGGTNWGSSMQITNSNGPSTYPYISGFENRLAIVWQDYRDNNYEIYYIGSVDDGNTWDTEKRLTNNQDLSASPNVAISGTKIHVTWVDDRAGYPNTEIYYKRSDDGGNSWGADTRLTNNSAMSSNPSLAVSGDNVHVAWTDLRDAAKEIYYQRSQNGGSSWESEYRLTNSGQAAWGPSMAISGNNVHMVWYDERDFNQEIYYNNSTDSGSTWGSDTRLTSANEISNFASIAVSGSVVHVVWRDFRDGNFEIYYKRNPTNSEVGIKELPSASLPFSVFPNPASNEIKVRSLENINELTIIDIYGKQIYHTGVHNPTKELRIPISDYASGIYIIQLKKGKGISIQKLIKL